LVDEGKLVMLKADWTRPNSRIAAFLASHDRFGIPFNIVYGPKAPEGVLLGELLRADIVETALIKAGMAR
jgi:suppressor for copper-sensitivity B